jgi:ribonuclease P protein component
MRAEPKGGRASLFEATEGLQRPGALRKRSEFEAVLRSALRVTSRNFVMRARANGTQRARLGIIAGRKAASRAVDRNRGKRLIREVFRTCPVFTAYDVTVQLRSDLRSVANAMVRAELRGLIDSLARRCAAVPRDA